MTRTGWSLHPPEDWQHVPDDALLHRARNGEAAAVDVFVQRFSDRLCSFLVRIVRDHAWADDLVQEVFVRALHAAHRYDPTWPVAVWLFRIARNLAVDLLRRENAHQGRLDQLADAATGMAPSAVTTVEHREFQVRLEHALQQLPEAFRSVFLLRDGEGMAYEEIGNVLGISVKTVSSRLRRARQLLRGHLGEHLRQ